MKIFVLFVEPMLYGLDLIHEVYEKTEFEFRYVYCYNKLTGKDELSLPDNAFICTGDMSHHKKQIIEAFDNFKPDFAVINGYVGSEQTTAIRYCQRHHIPYAIESDTPLHIPENKAKALLKKLYLHTLLKNKYCYGFPGGTLQTENLVHYGIPEEKNFIMPMSVSETRLLKASETFADKKALKSQYGLDSKTVFLFVGRLAPEKNVSLLIDAYAELKKEKDDIALVIVGDGCERAMLEEKVAKNELSDVLFAGYVLFPEIVKYYKMSDVFILPSSYEPWGLVVNEAMIMGLPVIVSDKVGCRCDLINNSKSGFVFTDGSLPSLHRYMLNLCDNSCQTECADNSIKRIAEWNYKNYLQSFLGAVQNAANKKI